MPTASVDSYSHTRGTRLGHVLAAFAVKDVC